MFFSASVTDDHYAEAWVLVMSRCNMFEGRNKMCEDEKLKCMLAVDQKQDRNGGNRSEMNLEKR